MKCIRFLGHKWSKWHKRLGAPKKDGEDRIVRLGVLIRRCASCGYIEEVWTNSCQVIEEAPDKLKD